MAARERIPRGARRLNILVLAVGKASGPEKELCERYAVRAAKAGGSLGIGRVEVRELPDKAGPTRKTLEGQSLLQKRAAGVLVALDERGKPWDSETLANSLRTWSESGTANATFALGGADGHPDEVREAADVVLSLSALTLPHLLARVVLLEQIYRGITICAGHPYHRS